jgi:tRNA (uracil-5-)-methyltransferase TRM9
MSSSVFDRIAPSWYNYRHYTIFRPELEELAARWQQGALINLGCGHGADFLPFAKASFELYGVDYSGEMLRLAEQYARKFKFAVNLFRADVSCLPFTDNAFDYAISVATFHHLTTNEARKQAFTELYRILKPGGEAFVTVWNKMQPRFFFSPKEVQVPWRMKDETLYRYYYLLTYGEFERLARDAGFAILKSSPEKSYHFPLKYFSRNITLLLKKAIQ